MLKAIPRAQGAQAVIPMRPPRRVPLQRQAAPKKEEDDAGEAGPRVVSETKFGEELGPDGDEEEPYGDGDQEDENLKWAHPGTIPPPRLRLA